ncbi:hypothetical protein GCM10020295_63400 [Streptomyces cinereospinus]
MTGIDTSRPHPARMYDWYLGGKDNYPIDEELGRQMLALDPRVPVMARVNRAFMHRATRWLAGNGVRQFLDIGTGIPTEPNLHQIAQSVAPDARVVYCDNDPIVLAHAAALLRGTPEGVTEYLQADVREPAAIIEGGPARSWTSAGPWRSPSWRCCTSSPTRTARTSWSPSCCPRSRPAAT